MKRAMSHSVLESVEAHFRTSGLSPAHLAAMQVKPIKARADKLIRVPVDCAKIPYFDLDGNPTDFYRLRLLKRWPLSESKKAIKYLQPPSSGSSFYLPPLLDRSWREIAADVDVPLVITEGEKKAACGCVHGIATIGLGGVSNWQSNGEALGDFSWFEWEGRIVSLAFDSPDVKTNRNVVRALEKLADELRTRGAVVKFVHIPSSGEKVGLDDYVVKSGADALRTLILQATDQPQDVVSELNSELALVTVDGRALVLREVCDEAGRVSVSLSRPSDIEPQYANRRVSVRRGKSNIQMSAFKFWLESPRRRNFDGVVFDPGGTRSGYYNYWKGFGVKPIPGDCSKFVEHVRENICSGDESLFKFVVGWMAHAVQFTSELPGTAIVLRGKQGVGKSLFCQYFGKLFGEHFVQVTQQHHLLGHFNVHLGHSVVVSAEEAVWGGDKAMEGVLKALITEPKRLLEGKGKDAVQVANFTRLLISSNHAWPVPAGFDERRMVVIDVGDGKIQDSAYFGAIVAEMNSGGLEALLHALQGLDISGFNPRSFPKTSALLDTKLRSSTGFLSVWYEMLQAGFNNPETGKWDAEVAFHTLHSYYAEKSMQQGDRRRAMETELGRDLRRAVPNVSVVRRRKGERQVRTWRFPSLEECRKGLEALYGQPIPWDEVEIDEGVKEKNRAKF